MTSNISSAKTKRRGLSLTQKKALSGWIFVLPFVIGIIFLYGPIVIQSIRFTFSDITISNGQITLDFVGMKNYVDIFNPTNPDKSFPVTLIDGVQDLILQIPAIVIFSLFMAIILNQKMTGRTVFRAIFFLPVILCTGIIDAIDSQSALLEAMEGASGAIDDGTGQNTGIMSVMDLQSMLGNIKLGAGLVDYVVGLVNSIFDIVSRSGVQMLIFLSGLQSISPAIYESCQIEGASAWETFWKITLPMISPMILVNFIYTIIDAFTSADNRVMNFIAGMTSATYQEEVTAMYWIYIIVVLLMIVLVSLLMKAFVFYQKRD